MINQELIILKSLIHNNDFFLSLITKLEVEDFTLTENMKIFESIKHSYSEYKTKDVTSIQATILQQHGEEIAKYFNDDILSLNDVEINKQISEFAYDDNKRTPIMAMSEEYILINRFERQVLMEGVDMIANKQDKIQIQSKLRNLLATARDVLSFTLEDYIGHDYLEDFDERIDSYAEEESEQVFSPLRMFNKAKAGRKKTLCVLLSMSNGGKCVVKNTLLKVGINDEETYKRLLEFKKSKEKQRKGYYNMYEVDIEIGDLFEFLELENVGDCVTNEVEEEIFIKSDKNEWTPILGYVKKYDREVVEIEFDNGIKEGVADTHIFRNNGKDIFAKDCLNIPLDTIYDNKTMIPIKVDSVGKQDVYDISIANPHWYTHNEDRGGLISHNTTHKTNWASYALTNSKNALYITLEDGDLQIAQRVDQNRLNYTYDEITDKANRETIKDSFKLFKMNKNLGRLIVKDFTKATPDTIRNYIDEVKIKKCISFDVVFVDYLGLLGSDKKFNNSYEKYKDISEDLRAIAKDYDLLMVTSAQSKREGFSIENAEDFDMSFVSESIAIAQTADTMIGIFPNKLSSVDIDDIVNNTDIKKETKHTTVLLKSRKVDKALIKPNHVRVFSHYQQVIDFDEDKIKRNYIDHDVKETMQNLDKLIEVVDEKPDEFFKEATTSSSKFSEAFATVF